MRRVWTLIAVGVVAFPELAQAYLPAWVSGKTHRERNANHRAGVANVGRSPTMPKRFQYTPPRSSSPPMVAGAWYAGWHGGPYDFPPGDVSYDKYTTLAYAFAETTADPSVLSLQASDQEVLPKVVDYAHQAGATVRISVGGWTGSQYFSTAVGSAANRTKFIRAINGLVNEYLLDGVDFDWEYPNGVGIGCNQVSPQDSANFLKLLKELRGSDLAENATLSAAVYVTPFNDESGNPMSDVSEFAKYLDYIEIMNYDIYGAWSNTAGPNAPLKDSCAPQSYQVSSAVTAVGAWVDAGFPIDQIVLGVASYGHSFNVTPEAAFNTGTTELKNSYPDFLNDSQPVGDIWNSGPTPPDQCGNPTTQSGIFDFWGLVTNGFLLENGTAEPGISYLYDNCSKTPSVYNSNSQVWIEYDDATSFAAKGKYIQSAGLRGFSMWEAGGDFDDILLDSIRIALGLPVVLCGDPVTTSRVYPSTTSPDDLLAQSTGTSTSTSTSTSTGTSTLWSTSTSTTTSTRKRTCPRTSTR